MAGQHTTVAQPRIIIHGGAGNITKQNLPDKAWKQYEASLQRILRAATKLLEDQSALDVAVYAVQQLELDPLFNAGRGAVFNRAGRVELEASVMVSRGMKKRGVGVSLLHHVKSPIGLAAQMLKQGEQADGGGAQGHQHMSGEAAEQLAKCWGLDLVPETYFWTKKRWQEHKHALKKEKGHGHPKDSDFDASEGVESRPDGQPWPSDDASWDGKEYLPQGTVGAVVLDAFGTIAVATSTGGLTNKLPGRIGDTPTAGAGFWAEEWDDPDTASRARGALIAPKRTPSIVSSIFDTLSLGVFHDCFPLPASPAAYPGSAEEEKMLLAAAAAAPPPTFACGLSGTGNGDSFLQLCAARTVCARARFTRRPQASLQACVKWMVGAGGEMQRAGGEGGLIGIQLFSGAYGEIVWDFNCGGMFRAYVDAEGKEQIAVFKD